MKRRRVAGLFAGILLVASLSAWVNEIRLLSRIEVHNSEGDVTGDCAVVLTGGPHRVREGFDLLAQGRVRRLIVSGVNPQVRLLELAPFLPFYGRIDRDSVILERRSQTTFGNAHQTRPLVESLGCRSLVLVTSQIHMPRAERMFRREMPKDTALVLRPVPPAWSESSWWDLALEALKSAFYSVWAF